MTSTPGKLTVDRATGRVTGAAHIEYNDPWPCVNGEWGSGAMMGVLMHTEDGYEGGTISWFNNPVSGVSAHFAIGEDGRIHQFGPIGKGWEAWHAEQANAAWYGIEHEDETKTGQPLTAAQVTASAQLVECLSAFAGFPLAVSDSPSAKGYGTHGMGGVVWGNHPGCPGSVRAGQRTAIIALAKEIRQPAPPAGWTYGAPQGLKATGGHTSVRLTWEPPAGAPERPVEYEVDITEGGNGVPSYPRYPTTEEFEGGSLDRGKSYTAHVTALGPAKTRRGPAAAVNFTTG